MSKFVNNSGKGFGMTFDNGFTISVQWGRGNYSSNRDLVEDDTIKNLEAVSAEIAVIDADGKFLGINKDEREAVIGWVSPDDVAVAIFIVAGATTSEGIKQKFRELNY
jgi:hypothetical protein